MATVAELRDKVLQKLEVLAVGETAEAADAELVEGFISTVHANFLAKAKIYWPSDNTPDEAVDSMVWIIADKCKTEFGKANDQEITIQAQLAMDDIAELNASEYNGQPTQACYF